jgi:hypothetical protein
MLDIFSFFDWRIVAEFICASIIAGAAWWGGRRGSLRVTLKKKKVEIVGRLSGLGHVCPRCLKETEILALDDGSFSCESCLKARK